MHVSMCVSMCVSTCVSMRVSMHVYHVCFLCVQVSAMDEGARMSGYLHKWHKGRKWKKQWYLVKDKVLYTFKATQVSIAVGVVLRAMCHISEKLYYR